MPGIIDYPTVLATMTAAKFRCNYPFSGSFSIPSGKIRGWIGPTDPTIRAEMQALTRPVAEPYITNLTEAAIRAWHIALPGIAWIMPASHWHFELHDGSRDWLPRTLADIGVDAKQLENRADGSAIQFAAGEIAEFTSFLTMLLANLKVSDFSIAFPGHSALCMVHHHKQLWWMSGDESLLRQIDAQLMPPAT